MNKYFSLITLVLLVLVSSCQTPKSSNQVAKTSTPSDNKSYFLNMRGDTIRKLALSDETWKSKLSEMEYKVLRQKGTERAFTGDLLDNKAEGLYTCRGCGMPLFASKYKFESGTGWPSVFDVPDKASIDISTDYDLGYARSELTCAKCGGHLGHVFDDGPKPTGKRYCINSVSLDFVKAEN